MRTPFDPNEPVSISPGSSSDRTAPKLGMRLLELNPPQCRWNDPILFTVEVVNLDSTPFRFPWGFQSSVKFEGPNGRGGDRGNSRASDGFVEGNVRLVFMQANGRPAPLGLGSAFRGSDNDTSHDQTVAARTTSRDPGADQVRADR